MKKSNLQLHQDDEVVEDDEVDDELDEIIEIKKHQKKIYIDRRM
jgi:hypothetical protein